MILVACDLNSGRTIGSHERAKQIAAKLRDKKPYDCVVTITEVLVLEMVWEFFFRPLTHDVLAFGMCRALLSLLAFEFIRFQSSQELL